MPRGKNADVETNEGNHTPNASEPIELSEQDSFELEVRDADTYSVSETLSRFFNDRHDLRGVEEKLEPKTKRWPRESIWMFFSDWVKKSRRSEPIGLLLLSQCKRYFIQHVSNKRRNELEKTITEYEDAQKINEKQIKLMADEICLLKKELTDLHTMLTRQGVKVAHTLDGGHLEGSDQGAVGGTLGANGHLYPTLPCGQDGEFTFPMQERPPSGGSEKEKHSIFKTTAS